MSIILRPYQQIDINALREGFKTFKRQIYVLPTGGGKCLSPNTPVLFYDGSIKKACDVKVGDFLMGPDSSHREVLSLGKGEDEMYRIIPNRGDNFECNESHILSLVCNSDCTSVFRKNTIHNISVKDYLAIPNHIKHCLKLYRKGIDFEFKKTEYDPYFLGLWLGDGTSRSPVITNMDSSIIKYLYEYAPQINHKVIEKSNKQSRAKLYSIVPKKQGWNIGFTGWLKRQNLILNKHIPNRYLINSREMRLRLLAGLIDTDGHLHNNCFEIFSVHKKLASDIIYLCRSLGFGVSVKTKKGVRGQRITFYGDRINEVPVLIERKKPSERKQIKNALQSSFKIEKIGRGKYNGFHISGDRLFMLGDFTVTHNTVVFSELIRLALNKDTQTLICTDRLELFSQTLKHVGNREIVPQKLDAKSKLFYSTAPVTVAMVETIAGRMKKGKIGDYSPELIVIDEAHKSSFFKIIDAFPNAKVIGCTATPKNKNLHLYYENMVSNIDIPELIDQGYLCKCKAYQMQDNFDDVKTTRGDFDEGDLFKHFNKPKLYAGLIEKWREKCENMKTLVFCVNIAHAMKTCDEFVAEGIAAKCVTSKTSDEERKEILEGFSRGDFPVIVNCGILTTGYDEPTIQAIVVYRATQSLTLWLQMCGRGGRPHEPTGKTMFILLDFGQNHNRLGMWAEAREWTLEAPKKHKKPGPAPVKNCPTCTAMLHASAMKCEFCGHIFEKKTTEEIKGVLVEIASRTPVQCIGKLLSQMTMEDIAALQKVKRISHGLAWRIVRSRGENAIVEYAAIMDYQSGWIQNQLHDLDDSKYTDLLIN